MRVVSVRSELANLEHRKRVSVLSGPCVPGEATQVVSGSTPVEFEKAFFYGLQDVPMDGSAPTVNVGSVFVGDGFRCVDEVTPECRASLVVTAVPGTKLDLRDFCVRVLNEGDRVFIRLQ